LLKNIFSLILLIFPLLLPCAAQIFSVFPARNTLARAISSSPSAGASRFILYSTVRTEESAGMSEYATQPHALSAMVPETPA
jgi:hypothetical protein